MNVNITWTITAIIAVSSFLSPIAVAIINNLHHAKMRKLELEHDEIYQDSIYSNNLLHASLILLIQIKKMLFLTL